MAKTKTKKEKIVDLKPKAEKITEEQLKDVQALINDINRYQLEIGSIETKKHHLLHGVAVFNDKLTLMQSEFEKEYGTAEINIQDGTIDHKKNEQTN